ncbi:MAG: 50S ribosomal protein L9 [Candidatus Pacebacteria bacterium]|jgi:large subunit ribosomal protein L9|nr:50S ribosomal protein L9 [Candidatus Paceibacterota bacterium]
MKIVFLKDVPKIGRRHEIKEVNDGYAINFLFPKGLAEPATPRRIAQVEKVKQNIRVEKEIKDDLLTKHMLALKDVTLRMVAKTNENGHLFSGIKAEDLSKELAKQQITLPPEAIVLARPIKELGEHIISVEMKNKKSQFTLVIQSEH